jgi:large subunit ribosomal protein L1
MICGKTSFDAEKLVENIKVIYSTILKLKPSTVKGIYFKNVAISTTMGPGIKVDTDQILVK